MRLLSHNVLRNVAKDVVEGFPLKIEATKVDVRPRKKSRGEYHRG